MGVACHGGPFPAKGMKVVAYIFKAVPIIVGILVDNAIAIIELGRCDIELCSRANFTCAGVKGKVFVSKLNIKVIFKKSSAKFVVDGLGPIVHTLGMARHC